MNLTQLLHELYRQGELTIDGFGQAQFTEVAAERILDYVQDTQAYQDLLQAHIAVHTRIPKPDFFGELARALATQSPKPDNVIPIERYASAIRGGKR